MNDMYTRLQEYNTSLQQYNGKLQNDLAAANESLKRVENEKATIVENLSTLRSHYNALQDQLTSSRVSCSDTLDCCGLFIIFVTRKMQFYVFNVRSELNC